MATLTLSPGLQSTIAEYGIFWQLWPLIDIRAGERRPLGIEVELIGAHTLDRNHLDPACLMCQHVKSVLLGVADLMINAVLRQDHFSYDIDSHPNAVLCLPALGSRSAVSVSVDVWWNDASGKTFETDLPNKIKVFLSDYGIQQR
jgi:hypothetical protein